MFKRLISLIITIVSAFTLLCFSVSAEEAGLIYLYTNRAASYLTISGSTATCKSSLKGYYGTTTKIEVTQTVQVKDGNHCRTLQSWMATCNSYTCDFVNTRTVYSGNTYRVKSEYKVYAGTSYETVYSYSTTKTT